MKNILIIDDAINCAYPVYAATDEEFAVIFPDGTDIEFSDDFFARVGESRGIEITKELWNRFVPREDIQGIHGMFFYGLPEKKKFYPTKKDIEMVGPTGVPYWRSADK